MSTVHQSVLFRLTLIGSLALLALPGVSPDAPRANAAPSAALSSCFVSYPNGPLVPADGGLGPGSIDDSTATTQFTVLPGDCAPGSTIGEVTIDVNFAKVGSDSGPGSCTTVPGGGDDWAEEIRMRLLAPDGAAVTLVNFDYSFSDPDVGWVTVTFDDDAASTVNNLYVQSGVFRPSVGALADFDGRDPAADGGIWTLELHDDGLEDPLCFGSATLHIHCLEPADLSLTKSDVPDPVVAGQALFYELTIHNSGPATATATVVTDTLPLALDYITDTAGCTLNTGAGPGGADQLVCPLGDILSATSRSVDVLVRVPADAVAADPDGLLTLTNSAMVRSTTNDMVLGNNTTTVPTLVTEQANLRVVKLSQPATTVQAGEVFTYTVIIDNLGPSFARSVTLSDTILSTGAFTLLGVVNDPNRPDSCTIVSAPGGLVIACTPGAPLDPIGYDSHNGRWQLQMRVQANEAQDVDNRVEVYSTTPDPDLADNQALDFISVAATANLALTKTALEPIVTAGLSTTWRVSLTNLGPSTARNIVISDTLPAALVAGSLDLQGDCTLGPGGNAVPGTPGNPFDPLGCQLDALPAGASAVFTITAAVDPAFDGAFFDNSVRVDSDTLDHDISNNLSTARIAAVSQAALSVTKSGVPAALAAGELLEYRLVVDNAGPSVAHDVLVLDTLPAELLPASASVVSTAVTRGVDSTPPGEAASCQVLSLLGQVACQLGDMPLGERVVVDVLARVPSSAVPPNDADHTIQVTNVVTVSASNGADFASSAATTINRVSDLAVDKSVEPPVAYAGVEVRYAITVTNDGPSDAVGVVLTDTLPLAADYEIDTAGCQQVAQDPDVLACAVGAIPAGESRQVDVLARIRADATPGQSISNTVTVAGSPDPHPANDSATSAVLVLGQADLHVLKFGRASGVVGAGENLTYTIIVDNLGPGYAHGVVLEDEMQTDGTFELLDIISDRAAACSPSPGTYSGDLEIGCTLTESLEVMTPLESGRWTLLVVVRANEALSISNVATVLSTDADPDVSNNQATAEQEVSEAADLGIVKTSVGQVWSAVQGQLLPLADQVSAGGLLTYTLVVTNDGPSMAENVSVQDRLPGWVTLLDAQASQGLCNRGTPGQPLLPQVCNLGLLGSQQRAVVTITLAVPSWVLSGTLLYNEALVLGSTFDPYNLNDFDTNETTVGAWATLSLSKLQQPAIALPGGGITYVITAANSGPGDAPGLTLVDLLPAGIEDVTWVCVPSGEATCVGSGAGDLDETIDLPVDSSVVYTVCGTLDTFRPLTNTAVLSVPLDVVGADQPAYRATATNVPYVVNLPLVTRMYGLVGPDLVVESIVAVSNGVEVTIRNRGNMAVENGFWVDVYLNPFPPPQTVNQVWGDVARQGMVWGVTSAALPLLPDSTLVLVSQGDYYYADSSYVEWPILPNTAVYAQVDSYSTSTTYGLVFESHEIAGGTYNNILGPIYSTASR